MILGCGRMHGWVEKNHLGAVSSPHETGGCADEFIGNDVAPSLSLCSVVFDVFGPRTEYSVNSVGQYLGKFADGDSCNLHFWTWRAREELHEKDVGIEIGITLGMATLTASRKSFSILVAWRVAPRSTRC